jgi:hypothetical protein
MILIEIEIEIEIEPFPVVQPTSLKLKLCHINLDRSTQHGNVTYEHFKISHRFARKQSITYIAAQTEINQKN